MLSFRSFTLRAALSLFALALAPSCTKGDLGAPCNHGDVQTPSAAAKVSFPITDCNENLCIYKTNQAADSTSCKKDEDCGDTNVFQCSQGKCAVTSTYVLENSMCSRRCDSDSDCKDGGVFDKVVYKETSCKKGFVCQVLQSTGPLCCTGLCVCADQANLQNNEAAATCQMNSVREACINTKK